MNPVIKTKYLYETPTKGLRIKASCYAGSMTFNRDFSLSPDEDMRYCAYRLAEKHGLLQDSYLVSGLMDDEVGVHVIVPN